MAVDDEVKREPATAAISDMETDTATQNLMNSSPSTQHLSFVKHQPHQVLVSCPTAVSVVIIPKHPVI